METFTGGRGAGVGCVAHGDEGLVSGTQRSPGREVVHLFGRGYAVHLFGIGARYGAEIRDRGFTASGSSHGRLGAKVPCPTYRHFPLLTPNDGLDLRLVSYLLPMRAANLKPSPRVLGISNYLLPKGGKVSGTGLVGVITDKLTLGEIQLTDNVVERIEEGRQTSFDDEVQVATRTNLVLIIVAVGIGVHAAIFEESGDQPVGMLGVHGEVVLVVDALWVDEVEHGVVEAGAGKEALEEFVGAEGVGWGWWLAEGAFHGLAGDMKAAIVSGGGFGLFGSSWSRLVSGARVLFAFWRHGW